MDFVTFWFIQYVFQSVLHSVLIALVVEALIRLWRIHRPEIRLRFLLLTLWMPVLAFPLFQLLYPERGSYRFREETALFDLNAWMLMRVWTGVHLWHLVLALMGLFAILFLVQDLVPILQPYLLRSKLVPAEDADAGHRLTRIMKSLDWQKGTSPPAVVLVQSAGPVLHLSGIRHPKIYINLSLVKILDDEELSAMLAHEAAHYIRKDQIMSTLFTIFRILLFFNPVALIEFRRMIHEREKLCDDIASRMTGHPLAVAAGLAKVFRQTESVLRKRTQPKRDVPSAAQMLELSAHRSRVEDRIQRLLHPKTAVSSEFPGLRLAVMSFALLTLLFFVV